jgi:amino acid permease
MFFGSKGTVSCSSGTQQEEFSTLNHHFAPYKRFNLSTGHQSIETSLQTLNESISVSTDHPIIDASGDSVEFISKDSKRNLHTMSGVFCPIALSMFAISIFMRMSFVLAHAGVLQTLLQLSLCFLIIFCTLLSVCSLATNGAIDGGGVYHMISRALGPEFGGSIGILFFLATVIGNGQSVAALVEALVVRFGPGSKKKYFFETKENDIYIFFK